VKYLVTGTAGFIGFHVAKLLISQGHEVAGIDGMTPYYDVQLKRRRHQALLQSPNFTAHEFLLEDAARLSETYAAFAPEIIIHLAAQAGVRYSLENPRAYIEANIVGTFNILETARELPPLHLMLASTSSVYGANTKIPFVESDRTDHPLTLYAATKKATEGMAHSYSHLWKLPTTLFRFFSVYGPWGRPDMALFLFTKAIIEDRPIQIYNHGNMERDFTYVDDLAQAIALLSELAPTESDDPEETELQGLSPAAPYRVVNIGNAAPVPLLTFIKAIEASLGRKAKREYLPMQPGDVIATCADNELLYRLTNFRPSTPVNVGVDRFVRWYRDYYEV